MPKAKWPHFSSVNPIIPKGSCYTLRKKVAIWPSNVGSVRLLFALYDKTNGGEESRSEGCQLVAWTLWYRRSGYNLLAHAMTEACTTTTPATLLAQAVVQQPPGNPSLGAGTVHLCCLPPEPHATCCQQGHCSHHMVQICFRHF